MTRFTNSLIFTAAISILCFFTEAEAQTPSATAVPAVTDNEVVRITSKLVQVDLMVVDKDGKQVRDLTAADFDLFQDGKLQKITGFSYVNKEAQPITSRPAVTKKEEKAGAIPPPVKITPANAGRIITFIVDDGNCGVSTTGMTASREGVQKFVREQMQPTDLVAIYQTRSGSSVFQQYTNDKTQLLKAAGKIRWLPPMGACSSDGSFYAAARSNTYIKRGVDGVSTKTIESPEERKIRENIEDQTSNSQVVGTLGVIRYVVQGLQRVPGRKVVFLLSDGLAIRDRSGRMLSAGDVLRDLTDLSNRASVVFNTIDSRGLFDTNMIEARDEVYVEGDMAATSKIGDDRTRDVQNSQDGLAFIANETGGRFYRNQNFLDAPIKKALSIETGYYLLAYEPEDDSFKSKKFNKIQVKLKRPDLKVIARTGFMGVVTETAKPKPRSENSELYQAIVSPLPVPGLSVNLSAYFANNAETGNFVRSFFHLDGDEITFIDDAGGYKKAVVDVVAVTLNEKNEVVDEFTRTHTIKFPPAAIPYIKMNGLVYSADVPIKKAGNYNFRVAVRDASSRMLGSAGQMVLIPDLKKSPIFLSALTISDTDADGKFAIPGKVTADNAFSVPGSEAVPAIRHFRKGSTLAYAYSIFNARVDKSTGKPNFTVQMNLFKDGEMIVEGTPQPAAPKPQNDWSQINDFAYLRLRPETLPGEYTIQLIVKDISPDGKNKASSQWVDFVIVD